MYLSNKMHALKATMYSIFHGECCVYIRPHMHHYELSVPKAEITFFKDLLEIINKYGST